MYIQAIKRHLKAESAKLLEAKMLRNNLNDGVFYQYDIMHDGKYFYAWFLKEQNVVDAMKEESNGKNTPG